MSQHMEEAGLTISDIRKKREIEIHGVPVSYRPTGFTTKLVNGKVEIAEIYPTFITQLLNWTKYGTDRHKNMAMISLAKEILLEAVRSTVFKDWCYEAPIAVSADVPTGCVYIDVKSGRIVLNEWQATFRYIDFDGDRGILIFNASKTEAILVKYPLTSQPLRLKVTRQAPVERFHDLTPEMADEILEKFPIKRLGVNVVEEELFYQKHTEVPVGLMTNSWNSRDLLECIQMPFEEKLEYIFNSHIDPETGKTQRALDIEDYGMKAARKAGKQFQKPKILEFGRKKALAHTYAWALTSCSSIGGWGKGKRELKDIPQIAWVTDANLDEIMNNIKYLNVGFRDVKPGGGEEPPATWIEDGLINRLLSFGLMRYVEYPSVDPKLPPSILLLLTLTNGEAVALTDIKREGRSEGMTFGFLLPPVFDNRDIMTSTGTIAHKATREWMHPIDHLTKFFTTFDSRILGPFGETVGFFPKNSLDFADPKRNIKVTMLYKALIEYCGEYGDPAPCTRYANGFIDPTQEAKATITRSVVIDYGRPMDEVEMWRVAKYARTKCNFSTVSSKSTSREVRKYMLANKYGGSILDPEGLTSPHRGGANRSQLLRALKPVKMTVAIVGADCNQVHITPSGVEKQITTKAFLPKCFGSEEEYQDFLNLHGWTEADCPADVHEYRDWQAGYRRTWVIDARKSIRIGKLVDIYGNKFMPRHHEQIKAIRSAGATNSTIVDVDLILPVNELIDKDAQHIFLKNARPRTIIVNGEAIEALIVEHKFYRTGAASENIPPRWRKCSFKGIDSFPIWHQVKKIKPEMPDRKWDVTSAKELQQVMLTLATKFPSAVSAEEDTDEYYY